MPPSIIPALKSLADPLRLRILCILERDELSVAELQEIFSTGQSRISTHLAQLKKAGLVEDRRAGKNVFYRLAGSDPAILELARRAVAGMPEAARDNASLRLVMERRRDRMRQYFDELAGRFGREYVPGRSWKGLAEALLYLMPPMTIADLGAGEGTFSQLLARSAKHVIAIDNSEKMVAYGSGLAARHGVTNLEYRVGDLEQLPIDDASVDLAFLSQSLHHAPHPELAVAEAFRILKPGGRIAVLDLKRHAFEQARELYADYWLGFPEVDLAGLLQDAGFENVHTAPVHKEPEPPHFETLLAVGRRPARSDVERRSTSSGSPVFPEPAEYDGSR